MKKLICISMLLVFIVGCAEQSAVKAPCNASGSNCYPRTKINQWYTGDDSN